MITRASLGRAYNRAGRCDVQGSYERGRSARNCGARGKRLGGLVITLSARHAGVTLGLAGFLLSGAMMAPGGAGQVAAAAGHRTGWSIVPSPNASHTGGNTLVQVSAGSATNAWAVGYAGGPGAFRTMAQRWNGSRWAVTRSPSPSSLDNALLGVDTLSPTNAWAVGYDIHVT